MFACLVGASALSCHASLLDPRELAALSLEDLGKIRITSVSKRSEPLADAAASVFVITSEDIRRSGVSTLPEALRLAPNLHVAQASSGGYAISARGFNGSNSSAPNKLLVMIDGRSVYSPLFSGVFWDVQDLVLENIERIEVISGPGSTLWGVNAVNGVINVITRPAAATQGQLISAAYGTLDSNFSIVHGGKLGAGGHYRVYARYLDRQDTTAADGSAVDDAGHKSQVGFRSDWAGARDQFMLSGALYSGSQEQPLPGAVSVIGLSVPLGDVNVSGGHLTGRWDRRLEDGASLHLQAYYDHTERDVPPMFSDRLDVLDLQFEHALPVPGRHALTWGANYRYGRDRVDNSVYFAFLPAELDHRWLSLFAQDVIQLADQLNLTVGARFEHNDYTGTEFLPSVRLSWKSSPGHMFWAAASRAVRAPSRLDRDTYLPGTPPFLLDGGRTVVSEIANVHELGYRGQPSPRLSWSGTVFHADYNHLRTQEIDPGFTFLTFGNGMRGHTTGVELWGSFQAMPHWRLAAGLTALDEELSLKPGSNDIGGPKAVGFDPSNTWQLRSTCDIDDRRQFDVAVRHVAELEKNSVPAYTTVDLRFGWRLGDGLDLSLVGRNLFGRHVEYGAPAFRTELEPSVHVKLAWEL